LRAATFLDLLSGSVIGIASTEKSDTKNPVAKSASSADSDVSKHGIYQSWKIPADMLGDAYHFRVLAV